MKQTLLNIKRTTTITTKALAEKAQLETADVFTVEIGGCATWDLAQKVVRAFNQLSGMQVSVDDIKFSPLNMIARNDAPVRALHVKQLPKGRAS